LLERGFLKSTEGNVSVRIPGRSEFAITPTSYSYADMVPDDICVLDFALRPLRGSKKASIEASMHATVYQHRPDVNVIIHSHQPYASALGLIGRPIPALFDEQVRYLGRSVEIIGYMPSGTPFLRRKVESKITNGDNAFILANHGALVMASDGERALFNVFLLEKCSLAYLLAILARDDDSKIAHIPVPVREIVFSRLRSDERKIARLVTDARPATEVSESSQKGGTEEGEPGAEPDLPFEALARQAPSAPPSEDQRFAISTYPDVDAVYRRLHALVALPRRPVKREVMAEYLDYYDTKCRRSKELTDEAKEYIPGGVQHNLAFNYPFPIGVDRAEGAYLWDVDGNQYIDLLQAGGPTVLGSNYAPVKEKVIELLESSGPVTGLFHEYELKLAELVNRLVPSVEMFRMFGSGTESVMAAIRAARAATKKRNIIKNGGAYHGWSDQMVYGMHVPGTRRFESKGIPFGATRRTHEVYPNSIPALRRKLIENQARGGTAAVILEPVGPESGTRPVAFDYNRQVRELCDKFGALLIFDEVVTGFRLGLGCAQGYFGVKPDLTVFGKCITGGYPMAGGVGGRADLVRTFAAGIGGTGKRAYVGGTLAANPMSCAAGYFAILEMERTNAPVLAGRAGDRLAAGLNAIVDRYGLPFVVYNQGSIVHLETSGAMLLDLRNPLRLLRELKPRTRMIEEMGAAYMANGLVTLAGSRMYTSMADTDDVIDDALERFEQVLSNIEPARVTSA
jgi:glutamate-1-semialdehyde aminotransferase/ribulose-5-phosphate 4-epimerase/fuculose-1-phosphate aldolase